MSVLNLLQTATLFMVMVMGLEGKEVLAYMLLRSMKMPALVLSEKRQCKQISPAAALQPLLNYPCFECMGLGVGMGEDCTWAQEWEESCTCFCFYY